MKTFVCTLLVCSTSFAATYYVSPLGNDGNAGTSEEQPFQMVQHAIDRMTAGDTLIVLDGVYTGTLKLKSGLTIRAKNPRKAVFSGAEVLKSDFVKESGNRYKTKVGAEIKQLFYKNQPMTWARWPNMTWAENWVGNKKWASSAKGSGPGVLKSEAFRNIADLDLAGGYCFLRYSKGNSCYSRLIKSFDGSTLHWDDSQFYSTTFTGEDGRRGSPTAISKGKAKPEVRARFYLAGALDLLDSEGEWFEKDGTLYFHAPGGGQPQAKDVLIKTNDYSVFEEDAISDLWIEGIDFFATSVKLSNPENKQIVFRDVHFAYIGAELLFIDIPSGKAAAKPIRISGSVVGFDKCLFAGGQNTGLQLSGSDIEVQNCVFAENNREANFQSRALVLQAKGKFKISRNTFFNNCSDAILIGWDENYVESTNPEISFNNICNAGIFNSDVSGVYMPNLSQHWTEFHHNWVHNVKGNGVRLDQAGEKLNVHHNVFWASKRGLNIEGFGNFNIYNNTSVFHDEADILTRNVVSKRKGTGDAHVSNDTSFPPITDWVVVNNLVEEFADRVGPSEVGPFEQSKKAGTLNPERAKNKNIPIVDRGTIRGNLTNIDPKKIFMGGTLDDLNLIPADSVVRGSVTQTPQLAAQGVTALDSFRGAYDLRVKGWVPGSDWMPYGLNVPGTMALAEKFARQYRSVSVVPEVNVTDLPSGRLSLKEVVIKSDESAAPIESKKKRNKKRKE